MVVIESLRAEGFRRLRLERPLTFEKGLTIIRGQNEAGKSTLIEAILYGLYGDNNLIAKLRKWRMRGEKIKLSEVVSYDSRRAVVEVVFRIGDKRYSIYRVVEKTGDSAKQSEARLMDLSSRKIIAVGAKATKEAVERIIGVSWKEILVTNVVAQKDLEHIIEMGRRERESVINLMMGLSTFNKARERVQRERIQAEVELETLKTKLSDAEKQLKMLKEIKRQYDKYLEEKLKIEKVLPEKRRKLSFLKQAKSFLERLQEYLSTRIRLEEKKTFLLENIKRCEAEMKDRENLLEVINSKINSHKKSLEELLSKRLSLSKKNQEKAETIDSLEKMVAKLDVMIREHNATLTVLKDKEKSLLEIAKEIGVDPSTPVEEWRSILEQKVKLPRLTVQKFLPSIVLITVSILLSFLIGWVALIGVIAGILVASYTVGRFYSESSKHTRAFERLERAKKLKKDINELESRLASLVKEFEKTLSHLPEKHQPTSLGGIEEKYSQVKSFLKGEEAEKTRLEKELSKIENEIKNLEDRVRESEEEAWRLRKEIEVKRKELTDYRGELEVVDSNLKNLKPPPMDIDVSELTRDRAEEDLETVKQLHEKYEREYDELKEEVNRLEERLQAAEKFIKENREQVSKIGDIEWEIKELESKTKEISLKCSALREIARALTEISIELRKKFAPGVERYMSDIIGKITDGRYKAVKIDPETYDIEVFDSNAGAFLRRDIYSGGTNDQFLLAMRIAFTLTLLQGAKGTYPKFLFLDEPLGSSDHARRQRILKLLNEELTKYFDQIILITHVEIPEVEGATLVTLEDGRVKEIRKIHALPIEEVI